MARGGEVVGAFVGREGVDDATDGGPETVDGSRGRLAEHGLELGEGVLDGVEVGAACGAGGRAGWTPPETPRVDAVRLIH